MAEQKHVHKLRRHTYKTGNTVYFCMLPDCSYKISTALALGKRCICHRCGDEFIMSEYAVRLAKPHCEKCHKPKGGSSDVVTSIDIAMPPPERVKEVVDAAVDLRSRLTGIVHSGVAARPDADEDI